MGEMLNVSAELQKIFVYPGNVTLAAEKILLKKAVHLLLIAASNGIKAIGTAIKTK